MTVTLKSFSLTAVQNSHEIQDWLKQFPVPQRSTAVDLVLKLKFVPGDVYSDWLKKTLLNLDGRFAVYAVRKFVGDDPHILWDAKGECARHVIRSSGSEDLVRSVFRSLLRLEPRRFFDHPSLKQLRESRPDEIVLLDDSIGSGKRTLDYINAMLGNPTFLSWWSYGRIKFHVISFLRNDDSRQSIIRKMPGSDHATRRYPKSSKVSFSSYKVYRATSLREHWGSRFESILDLCESTTEVPKSRRLGFGDTMSNVIFYHSVPNNIPGLLWFNSQKWQALFPSRVLPSWAQRLLEGSTSNLRQDALSKEMITLLSQIKRGVRVKSSLSREVGLDLPIIAELLTSAQESGFLTQAFRLTKRGDQLVKESSRHVRVQIFDRSLYIPKKWSVDQEDVQPLD